MQLRKEIGTPVFTHDQLEYLLSTTMNNVNAKISYMVNKGELIRLKKGIYVLGADYQKGPVDIISVANILYAPSYVSYDYALSYYGLIPERVYEITSATLRGKKSFETDLGRFSYKPVPLQVYAIGVDWLYDSVNGGKLIAAPEKALCDKVRSDRGMGRLSQEKLAVYLEYDLRIEWDGLRSLDTDLIATIATAYRSSNLKNISKLIAKRKKSA
ncbi:MAG: hypothetical protein U9Q90_01115 [Campylobacterota bacterium]|nr:hypothetical protein [Campylobacterota bacterium]